MTSHFKVVGQLTQNVMDVSVKEEPVSIIELEAPQGRKGYTHCLRDKDGASIGWLWPIKSRPGVYQMTLYSMARSFKGLKGRSLRLEDYPVPAPKPQEPEYHSPRTVGDLADFVAFHKLGEEEYFSVGRDVTNFLEPIYLPTTKWLAVYWVEGGSEGYYVHVDRLSYDRDKDLMIATTIATGKYWLIASANHAVGLLTPFVHGLSGRP